MQGLLTLLIITIFCLGASICCLKILWAMMQDEGAFDVVFKLGTLKDKLYASGKPFYRMLENILGGCAQCMSFWFSLLFVIAYYIVCKGFNVWASDFVRHPYQIIVSYIILSLYWGLVASLSHYFITRKSEK